MNKVFVSVICLFVIVFVSYMSNAQVDIKLSYNSFDVYEINDEITNFKIKQTEENDGTIIIKSNEIIIYSVKDDLQKLKVKSKYNDRSTNKRIYICYKNGQKYTAVYGSDNNSFSIFSSKLKYIYKLD